jgi:uncharacterized LabA/DUF88 family protein
MRGTVFIDGQNLFHSVKALFGYRHPNFDTRKLASAICEAHQLQLAHVYFYTGMPTIEESPDWHAFWSRKLAVMGRQENTTIFNPPLRYRDRREIDSHGRMHTVRLPQEKGIDVRIALDMVRAVTERRCESIILLSQDSDLRIAMEEAKRIARDQSRHLDLICAFPERDHGYARGIENTHWFAFDRAFYDRCLDTRDYWRKSNPDVTVRATRSPVDTPSPAERAQVARDEIERRTHCVELSPESTRRVMRLRR